MAFELKSSAFSSQERIPSKYTCDGEDVSPPLEWNDPPENTKSLALIADDPDAPAGTWVHWVLYNLDAKVRSLRESPPSDEDRLQGGLQGMNSWGKLGYGGPCPPSGTHRYYFKLYALDREVELSSGATKAELLQAMEGKILAQTELMGKYSRA